METLRFVMVSTHFPPSHLGGDAMYVKYLAEELVGRGHEVHVFFNPGAYRLLRGALPPDLSEKTIPRVAVHPYESRHEKVEPLASLTLGIWGRAQDRLEEIVRTVRPDVVHWHNTKGFVAVPVRVGNEIPLHTVHDYHSVCPRSNLLRPDMTICEDARLCQLCLLRWRKPLQLWRMAASRVVQFPDELTLISPSRFVSDRLQREGIIVNHVLRNFVPDCANLSANHRVKRNLLLFLGMLESHKGPKRLIEAFNLCRNSQDFEVAVIGRGPAEESLRRTVQSLNLQDRIHLYGFMPRSDVIALLGEAAALVIPSEWHENAPLVSLEAFSLATPALGSDLGGLPEILTRDAGSMVFQGRNTKDLADKITDLWERRNQLVSLGRKARREYEKNYSPSAHIPAYLEIINEASTRQ